MRTFLVVALVFTAACTPTTGAPRDAGDDAGTSVDSGQPPIDAGAPDAGEPPEEDAGVPSLPNVPLGATVDLDAGTIDFRVYSANATRLELSLYRQAMGAAPVQTAVLSRDESGVFSTRVELSKLPGDGLTVPLFYGYRAWGPNWRFDEAWAPGSMTGFVSEVDAAGNRFNPNKLLLDPYAPEMSHDPSTPAARDGSVFQNDTNNRSKDSGPRAPKGVVLAPSVASSPPITRPFKDEVVYEVHLKGLTRNDPSLPAELRGTYAGAARKAEALKALGVTAVEFLPLHETQNDTNDVEPNDNAGDNYWGYSTLSYFAPDRRYASDRTPGGPTREVQAMVRAFHEAGLKVYVDVVYNHTGEYGLLSWRGLDNSTYYSLTADRRGSQNHNGVSGDVNARHPATSRLIIDSLRYWHEVLGVDGFRFDLAPILGNTCQHGCFKYDRTDPNTALSRIAKALARPWSGGPGVDLIAEPWGLGDGTYQMGNFPSGWAEWNDAYRDAIRGKQNLLGFGAPNLKELAERLGGSHDKFFDDGRPPSASVNFVVAHDGFTLNDLYSCNAKNNGQAWPYGPSNGGSDNNRSWDQGGMRAAQLQAARTGLSLLMLSAGTPMMTGGDEQLHSLRCNNNPYNLDSDANGLSFSLGPEETEFRAFTSKLLAFRHAHPALRPARWYRLEDGDGNGLEQVKSFTPAGTGVDAAYLGSATNHAIGWRLDGTELGDPSPALYVAYNGWSGPVEFTLPTAGANRQWHRVADTCTGTFEAPGGEVLVGGAGSKRTVCGRGLWLFVAK